VSPQGKLLLYEVKEGGERTGSFELLEVESRLRLSDSLPRGLLRGFVFAPHCGSFYYVHEPVDSLGIHPLRVLHHILGTPLSEDVAVFETESDDRTRLFLIGGTSGFGIYVQRHLDGIHTDFYVRWFDKEESAKRVLSDARYLFEPVLLGTRVFALTDREAPNLRIVEICCHEDTREDFKELVPETDIPIRQWALAGENLFVMYTREVQSEVEIYDLAGVKVGVVPVSRAETIQLIGPIVSDELLFETQSFAEPISLWRYTPQTRSRTAWATRKPPLGSDHYQLEKVLYTSKDGTSVPMFLLAGSGISQAEPRPTIMTAYGGYGVPMTPRFSVLITLLLERGCLFALPSIRGGSELGVQWHNAAKRRNRQNAYDDFLCAAEWLVENKKSTPQGLGIFGASNSGLLVAAALTQRPDLFRAVACMVPLVDMLRYHIFDEARFWKDEFGSAEDREDFAALSNYSPYHRVVDGTEYPATLLISGDADGSCNPMHARKMTARLQRANASVHPILLDYSSHRGHASVLPLSERVNALTDRLSFLCDQLQLVTQ
jgi:prolyl oligopeptidase